MCVISREVYDNRYPEQPLVYKGRLVSLLHWENDGEIQNNEKVIIT